MSKRFPTLGILGRKGKEVLFKCPKCNMDITDTVIFDAYCGGESMPADGQIECKRCYTVWQVTYEWKILLGKVEFS